MSTLPDRARAARLGRMARVRNRMDELGMDALLLSHGADLPWLTGYRAMPLERLTMLVLRSAGDPVLVVPALEAPRVAGADELFTLLPWTDDQDPIELVASILTGTGAAGTGGAALRCAISDRAWATTVLALQRRLPAARWAEASTVTSPIRAVKDDAELAALRMAGSAADRVAAELQGGGIGLIGRKESEVSGQIAGLLIEEGHQQVNFAIVGSGPNAASPHHEPAGRVIGRGETVVCDFGGSYSLDGDVGYCSDITRTVVTGSPSTEIDECYQVLFAAQQAAVLSARAGVRAEHVDHVAREIIHDAGFGHLFVHRTGHGIGIEEHEDPYVVSGNEEPLQPGHAFSVEPGIYWPDRFGMRLEDIVVIGDDGGPEALNSADHRLVVVDV
ncbi:MAG TPA: Xaa-Pro peptidase family protein [Acidimicrobiales bacterium]|nr:Xaa-Pro peptidase family protein [Acidimicrobiales bacterium]